MNDDNRSLSPATRDTRVICGWVTQIDIIISFSVAEFLSHAYYMVDLDLIWPFHSTETRLSQLLLPSQILFEVLSTYPFHRIIFADFYFSIRENGTRNLAHHQIRYSICFDFLRLIDFDLLWKLKPLYADFFLCFCFFDAPRCERRQLRLEVKVFRLEVFFDHRHCCRNRRIYRWVSNKSRQNIEWFFWFVSVCVMWIALWD